MEPEFISYLHTYGYLAIFVSVLLPEIGVPVPFPIEFLLLFAGYFAWNGQLSLPIAFATAVSADFLGAVAFYLVFYWLGKLIIKHKPHWIPLNTAWLVKISKRLKRPNTINSSSHQNTATAKPSHSRFPPRFPGMRTKIYIGRLIAFVRGYVSAAAGFLQIPLNIFAPSALLSAITWSGGYVMLGFILGPRLETTIAALGGIHNVLRGTVTLVILAAITAYGIHIHWPAKKSS